MEFFYSHGFHSSKDSISYKRICEGLGIAPFELIYDNGGDFMINMQSLATQLKTYKQDFALNTPFGFIGNSLGAFYLWQLILFAKQLDIPLPHSLVFFNPVFEPLAQLKKYIDKPQNISNTQSHFTLSKVHWQSYALALRTPMPQDIRTIVCLSMNDERIDSSISQAYWQYYAQILYMEGGHIITDFKPLYTHLHSFLRI
ncbi:YqiA/YcfP family alpha/beta fold hydrolase [Helicobacter japonicus]|uniref:YqiA/YcfP family alpha/beta fold hydrolase n=1 Tax=Helicobacter japonicus TaxID=425400 RepID=UPI0023F2C762|nr:YqiA/YcfP family alpha/beta fold hydrolase [Helicobacter japonicus]